MFSMSFILLTRSKMAARPPSWIYSNLYYLRNDSTDFYKILQFVALRLQVCSPGVLAIELDPKWRHGRHLGLTKIFNISGTTRPISTKFCRSSHLSYGYVLYEF